MMYLITGGVSQGKSSYAEALAASLPGPRMYLATLEVYDDESRQRVLRHRERRAGLGFTTLECQRGLSGTAVPQGACVLLECMTNLAANELFGGAGKDSYAVICQGVEALMTRSRDLIIVTNEVGADGVTYTPEVMEYIRLLSRLNRRMAGWADRVVELVCGLPIVWKG